MSLHYLALTDEQLARIRAALVASLRHASGDPMPEPKAARYSRRRALNDFDAAVRVDHDQPYPYV